MTEEGVKLATCQVVGKDESGTGWLVTKDRILTAYHCVKAAHRGSKPEPPKIPSADQRGLSRARSMG